MEKSYSKILVAYDGSELSNKALKVAADLAAKDREIKLDILHVIKADSPVDLYGSAFSYQEIQDMKKRLKEEAITKVEEIKGELDTIPNETQLFVLDGDPANEIVEFAKAYHYNLIVMGSRGLNRLKELFLGSVSHHVVQRSHCPVFIVK